MERRTASDLFKRQVLRLRMSPAVQGDFSARGILDRLPAGEIVKKGSDTFLSIDVGRALAIGLLDDAQEQLKTRLAIGAAASGNLALRNAYKAWVAQLQKELKR